MMKLLFRPIDAAILIYFRIVAGVLLAQELVNQLMIGKFHDYIAPKFHLSYMFFEWVKPWSEVGMAAHYGVTIFAALAVAFNYKYRIFSIVLFLGYTSLFLMEASFYINHIYLYCLLTFWMMFLPLDKNRISAPAWNLYLILFHMSLAYFFGGIAKLNSDWLMGTPMDIFLQNRTHLPLGFIYEKEWAPYAFSYGGLFFDLMIVPMMVFKPTRKVGLVLSILFHLSNVMMFGLATFPWFSLLLTSMFFDPSWPRKIPLLRKCMPWNIERAREFEPNQMIGTMILFYIVIHAAIPFRHVLYPGNPDWTEEGHQFSWRMMLRDKTGTLRYIVQSEDRKHVLNVNLHDFITERQISNVIGKPDLILNLAHQLRDHYAREWNRPVRVFASSRISFNGRPKTEIIEQGIDLGKVERKLGAYEWIRPLESEKFLIGEN